MTIGYRLFYGENRLSELSRLQLKQTRLESQYAGLRFERRQLEENIANLQGDNINLEALEMLVRAKLKMARADEVVLIMPETQEVP